MTNVTRATVFYDGACPLCRREIAHYAARDRAGLLAFADIAADPAPLAMIGIDQAQALARLHVRRADGVVLSGARAFAEIWSCLPRWRLLARALRGIPGAMALAEAAYRVVARHRVRVVATLCARGRCAA
ncbi:MAG: DUF393 domain-containing protein [Alphaproteobacteria bacterium]|nr:DUF393 domain-containing protein [Alphaproteobacteria bacterium]